jgi:hypothetical protein
VTDVSERFFEPKGTAGALRAEAGTLLDDVRAFMRRFVVMSDAQADAVALWTAHTHAVAAAETTPYLAVTSAVKRSGKTRLREVLGLLVREPLAASNISDAALFRAIDKLTPTLLLDEADAIFKAREREDLRGMLNAGYRRGAVAYRIGGAAKSTLEHFPVFCAKAFFRIGDFLPDTLSDRALHIRLERRLREETVERFRERDATPEGEILRDRLADWLEPQVDELHSARPDLPTELDDRAQDSWEALFAIADLAGGDWPERARSAALTLSTGEEREDDSLTAELLRDLRTIFETNQHIKTGDLLALLHAIDESPWADYFGKPLSAHGLSRLLKPYRIKTQAVWIDGSTVRGYKADQFADAFARVLGVRSVRTVRSDSQSQNAPNAPNAPNASGDEGTPLPGDELYPLFLAEAGNHGHITENEFSELYAHHKLIERALRGRAEA